MPQVVVDNAFVPRIAAILPWIRSLRGWYDATANMSMRELAALQEDENLGSASAWQDEYADIEVSRISLSDRLAH